MTPSRAARRVVAEAEAYAPVCERAFATPLRRYGLRRVRDGLSEHVPEVAWANDHAFVAVMVDPRDGVFVYVGRLVDGAVPPYSGPPGGPTHWLDMGFFLRTPGCRCRLRSASPRPRPSGSPRSWSRTRRTSTSWRPS